MSRLARTFSGDTLQALDDRPGLLVLEWVTLGALLMTVLLPPWFLGSIVPFARLILQVGAVCTGTLALLLAYLRGMGAARVSTLIFPLLGIAFLGLIQLLPVYGHPIAEMNHAVNADFRSAFPPELLGRVGPGTVDPASTRLVVAQFFALAVIAWSASRIMTTPNRFRVMLAAVSLNGCAMLCGWLMWGNVADSPLLSGSTDLLSEKAIKGFGTFVNPNNAAAWLSLCCAAALGWMIIEFGDKSRSDPQGLVRHRPANPGVIYSLLQKIAGLTNVQVIVVMIVCALLVGVAATGSRGGILAAGGGMAAAAAVQMNRQRSLLIIVGGSLFLVVAAGGLALFGYWESLTTELSTLTDPLGQLQGRIQHWNDVLRAVPDFPLLGSGWGSYRYAALPYNRQPSDLWYRNADNQYVEVLIEGGLLGALLFLAVGGMAVLSWQLVVRAAVLREKRDFSDRFQLGLGSCLLAATVSVAVSSLADFGVFLPGVSALFVLLTSAIANVPKLPSGTKVSERPSVHVTPPGEHPVRRRRSSVVPVPDWLIRATVWQPSAKAAWLLPVLCVLLSVLWIPDLLTASEVWETRGQGKALVQGRIQSDRDTDDARGVVVQLRELLKQRPDDLFGWSVLLEVETALHKRAAILSMVVEQPEERQWRLLWDRFSSLRVPMLLQEVQANEGAATAKMIADTWLSAAEETGRTRTLGAMRTWSPLEPSVAVGRAVVGLVNGAGAASVSDEMQRAAFVRPADPDLAFAFGAAEMAAGRQAESMVWWNRSVSISGEHHALILQLATQALGLVQAMEQLEPKSYSGGVRLLRELRPGDLRSAVVVWCEDRWEFEQGQVDAGERPLDEMLVVTRSEHLEQTEGASAAIFWLEEQEREFAEPLVVLTRLAGLLESFGDSDGALDVYRRLEYLDPGGSNAAQRIQKIESTRQIQFGNWSRRRNNEPPAN